MNLSKWYLQNFTKPLLISTVGIMFVLLLFNTIQFYREIEQKNQALDDVVRLATLGLSQKNRVLVESTLNLAVNNLNISQVTLCEDGNLVYSHPSTNETCTDANTSLLSKKIRKSAIGLKGIDLIFTFSWLKHLALLLYSFAVLIVISSTFAFLVWKLKSKFLTDLLEPLLPSYKANSPIQEVQNIVHERKQLEEYKVKSAVGEALSTMAAQVSHDIRSPLSALTLMLGGNSNLPEPQRIMMRSAIQRINDIANELLSNRKHLTTQIKDQLEVCKNEKPLLKTELLTPLIDNIVSEKRVQFREKQGVEIESDINQGYGLFANINANELKRTISNLVNNAVEAFPNETGKVTVAVRNYGEQATIIIQDNGKGIPEHILKKLGEMGVSHGKEGTQSGSGLGVCHAKKTVEDSGGKFQIQSREGAGTTITMTFCKAIAPKWFVEKLTLTHNMMISSLDDDISIHQIWKGRFESKNVSEFGIEHRTFTSGLDFKAWVTSQPSDSNDAKSKRLYLVDYELLNQNATGLDIIEELGIGSQAILVTSRYEEDKIRERCDRLGVKLIPKAMAGFVPIEIAKPKEFFDGILLDDDSLVHSCWAMDANNKNKKFVGFYNADDFLNRAAEFDTNTKVYVDSNLGNGVKGEVISKKIYELGFNNIYLCTGYQASEFPAMSWIKEIVPKDPQL